MIDHLHDNVTIYELKIVADASPDHVERSSEQMGYRISAAAYVRAVADWKPELIDRITFRFLFCEPDPPYAIYDPPPTDIFLATGNRDWLHAVGSWARCTSRNEWPGYRGAGPISRPTWALRKEGYMTYER